MTITRYATANLSKFFDDIDRYSLGFDTFFDRVTSLSGTYTNYPPVNIVQESDTRRRVEIALAGFNSSEIQVYTESGKLVVEGAKNEKSTDTYIERGVALRNFKWARVLPETWKVETVTFVNGLLTISIDRHVPEHEKRQDYRF
jgi:molecular chaperone IbpA